MDFKNVPKKYRPIPFWSWNSKLIPDETAHQVKVMDKAGMGGFFMHARAGLKTEYMSEEWFENVSAAIDCAKECGMRPWAYDENGWPSGFGNGAVNGLGVEYQQKYLRMEDEFCHKDTSICKSGNHWFYYDINPFYVDTLDKKVVKEFIDRIYQPYYDRYKTEIEGFFTDEPQISRNGIPWSFVYEKEYFERYGEQINEHLEELFLEVGNYKDTRFKFWKMVTDLFSSAFMKQIYDWCDEHGLKLTGHLVLEESLMSQLITNGACMPHYEYFHIPGMDWLGRDIYDTLTAKQVSSVAAQTKKEAVLSETFALCGHNVSFDELKGLYEWQMVRGVNLLCQHLEGYSIGGTRKRDYPPAMYHQQPWWNGYEKFVEAVSRIGMILGSGKEDTDVLIIHPMSSAWILYNTTDRAPIDELNEKFIGVIKELEKKHISYHLGDETIMQRHAFAQNGELVIGAMRYSKIILPPHEILFPSTEKLLEEFKASGGKIVSPDELDKNGVIDNENITYAKRICDGYNVHYFVNTSPGEANATLGVSGKKLDIYTGDLLPLTQNHKFEPWGSLVVIEEGSAFAEDDALAPDYVYPDGEFEVCGKVQNTLLLDKCDYYFDGELQEKNGYVLSIAERANALKRKIAIKQDYHVRVNYIPSELYLVCEKPENFEISVNGQLIDKTDCGSFVDVSFRKFEISKYIKQGENIITFTCDFVQREQFYKDLANAYRFEGEKNKLVYDMEIEAAYLLGDFSVSTDGKWENLDKNAQRYFGEFVIDAPKTKVSAQNLQNQGFPFFCGSLTIEKEFEIGKNTVLKTSRQGVNVLRVKVGENEAVMVAGSGEINLSALAPEGKHKVKITLTNNLRNLLGPHHLIEGESYSVGPFSFFKEPCIWHPNAPEQWDDDYCFVNFGI